LWYEGASSFGGDLTEIVFRKTAWALRSEGKFDPSLYGWSYSAIVQSGRYSAHNHFHDDYHPWPSAFVGIAQKILSDQEIPLPKYNQEAIYFISTTHFLRRAPAELNGGTPYQAIKSSLIPGSNNCPEIGCAFPDIRWRGELFSKSIDREERFIKLPAGTYQLYYREYNQNQYEECYWIGIYFNNIGTHNDVFTRGNNYYIKAPNYPVNDIRAKELKCPS
jgi:hypothetical protein